MWEFAPIWQWARMTRNQVRKYIKDMEEKRELAKKQLEEAIKSWELSSDDDLLDLEQKIDNL